MTTSTLNFEPSAPLDALMGQVRSAARKNTSADWGAILVNAPLFILTYGIVQLSTEDESALATTAMPDDWVLGAAALPSVSAKNLRKLQRAFDSKGFVSIKAADQFCTVEFARERQAAENAARERAIGASEGYHALSTRLAGEGFDPSFEEALITMKGYAVEVSKVGASLVSMTAEAAEVARRQVGAAFNVLNKLRGDSPKS
jgi:hypothetical protein